MCHKNLQHFERNEKTLLKYLRIYIFEMITYFDKRWNLEKSVNYHWENVFHFNVQTKDSKTKNLTLQIFNTSSDYIFTVTKNAGK